MGLQPRKNVGADAAFVHQGNKGRLQPQVSDILRDVAADTAMHIFHPPGIPAAGNIGARGITLDVHKDRSENDSAHGILLYSFCSMAVYSGVMPSFS